MADFKPLFGWAGPEKAKQAVAELGLAPFRAYGLVTAPETRKLWDFTKKVLGKHTPNYRQEIGDCVSFGMKNAIEYLQCVQVAKGERYEFHPVFPPFIYGTSRHDIGGDRLGGSDGSLGSWAAEAVKRFGILFSDDAGVPKYEGRVASQWGSRSGPPKAMYDVAKDNPVKTVAQVNSFEEAAIALSNGYPVTTASMQGFAMEGREKDGKLWGVPQGSWAHQMCFVGVDMAVRALFCLNSWGDSLWSNHPDDAPPGGFWVDERTANRMCSDDSWACSQFEGFPAQKLDHLLL